MVSKFRKDFIFLIEKCSVAHRSKEPKNQFGMEPVWLTKWKGFSLVQSYSYCMLLFFISLTESHLDFSWNFKPIYKFKIENMLVMWPYQLKPLWVWEKLGKWTVFIVVGWKVNGFVTEGWNWTQPIVEGRKTDFFSIVNWHGKQIRAVLHRQWAKW